jgi:hypothetical protein
VDTNRDPPRPNTNQILLNGPTVFVRDSDPPGQLIEMPFVLDPPFALPGPGLYAFFIQRENCDGGQTLVIANDTDPYPYGNHWVTPRALLTACTLRPVDAGGDSEDLIFRIEFCRSVTAVPPRSWGRLKGDLPIGDGSLTVFGAGGLSRGTIAANARSRRGTART